MFIFNLKVSLAQREIGKTSERIRFVFQNKREKGEITSGTKKYGYDIVDKHFVVNELEAINIVNLYKYFINVNGNVKETYKYFVQNFQGKGQNAMSNYLRETAYIGKYKLYRKDIYIDNYIPRIMEDDLFFQVQSLLKKKEKHSNRTASISLFSGLVYCNNCQHRMTKKQDNRVKNRLIRYCCDNATRRKVASMEYKCSNHKLIRESYIEEYLLNNICNLAKNYICKNTVASKAIKKDNSKQIKDIEKRLSKLKDLYLDDLIDKETYSNDYKKLNTQLKNLKIEEDTLENKKDLSKLKELVNANFSEIYKKLSLEEKRTFYLNIIDKIYIENNNIKEITFL